MTRVRALLALEPVRYAIVGASGVVVDLSVLALLVEVIGVPLLIANVVSFGVAVAGNYALNARWTFHARGRRAHVTGGAWFLFAALVGLAINEVGLWLLATRLGVFYVGAKIALVVLVFAWNYTFNSVVTFRRAAPRITPSP